MFIKQVPDTDNVFWTENNNIDRTKMDSIINPADLEAIEAALKIKEKNNAYITAVTMGPEKAKEVLKEAVARGVDDGILLCDSKFAGSDTLATSVILSSAVKEILPDTDLLIFGQTAIDGETGQTGECVAARLNYPSIGHITDITEINDNYIEVLSSNINSETTFRLKLPASICVNNFVNKPKLPLIEGYIKSQDKNYKTYNLYDLNILETQAGLKGSPTYVWKVYKREETRNGVIFDFEQTQFNEIYKEIKKVL